MRRFMFILCLSVLRLHAFSQQDYFLYIQSDEHLPFYARINNRIYSSSESGNLIIPKLADSTYPVTIGFAKSLYPEQLFTIPINKNDKGFQLKKSGEKGWGLMNLQTMATLPGTSKETKPNEDFSGTRKTDAFSQMLANVVNDSSILYTAIAVNTEEPEKKKKTGSATKHEPVTVQAAPTDEKPAPTDSLQVATSTAGTENKKEPAAIPDTSSRAPVQVSLNNKPEDKLNTITLPEKPFIVKLEEVTTPFQYMATYLEQYNFKTDTIRIIIALNETATTAPAASTEKQTPFPDRQQAVTTEVNTPPAATTGANSTVEKKSPVVLLNSDCKNIASEHDVDKLRIKLLADNAVDDKLVTARKYFRNKCFTVKQIRALAELFPTDETKYRFFDTSYPFVSDTGNVYLLEDMIQNDYYKNRFKAMIHR